MIAPLLHASELFSASESGPVFRSLFLPSRSPLTSVSFYSSFGFRETMTRVEGVPQEFPTSVNDWHTLIFYTVADRSPVWASAHPVCGVIPRFVCTGGESFPPSLRSPDSDFEEMEVSDPDGRLISFMKPRGSPKRRRTGLLCWIDSLEAFRHTFIRIEQTGDQMQATAFSFTKQSGSLHWPPGRVISVDERSTLALDPADVAELASCLLSIPPTHLKSSDGDNYLADHIFYRFLIVDEVSDGLEFTVPLSQIEWCLARLSRPFRILLGCN
jgi:hypothetical protein